jgi:hypothetical protein
LNITSSTFSGNHIFISGNNVPQGQTADAIGGGLAAAGDALVAPILRMTNTTITENSVESTVVGPGCASDCRVGGGGVWFKFARFFVTYSTITENTASHDPGPPLSLPTTGGGFQIGQVGGQGILILKSSVVANNHAQQAGTENLAGPTTSQGYNLFNDTPNDFVPHPKDQVNTTVCFDPLADYGGETETLRPRMCDKLSPSPPWIRAGRKIPGFRSTSEIWLDPIRRRMAKPTRARSSARLVNAASLGFPPATTRVWICSPTRRLKQFFIRKNLARPRRQWLKCLQRSKQPPRRNEPGPSPRFGTRVCRPTRPACPSLRCGNCSCFRATS